MKPCFALYYHSFTVAYIVCLEQSVAGCPPVRFFNRIMTPFSPRRHVLSVRAGFQHDATAVPAAAAESPAVAAEPPAAAASSESSESATEPPASPVAALRYESLRA